MSELEREEIVLVEVSLPSEFKAEDDASLFASRIPVAHPETEPLLYDPLEYLRTKLSDDRESLVGRGVKEGWTISVTRLHAEFGLPMPVDTGLRIGPHHHLCLWLVLPKRKAVHLLMHRSEPPGARNP
jgi:hypothetical protein